MRWRSLVIFAALLGFTGCGLFSSDADAGKGKAAKGAGEEVAPGRTAVGGVQPHEMDQVNGVSDSDAAEAFYSKGFHYCDAVMLAGMWDVDTWDAKVKAGRMATRYEVDALNTSVESARSATRDGRVTGCTWESIASFEDVMALASYWGQDSSDVKTRLEQKATWGQHALIQGELASARQQGTYNEGDEGMENDMNEERWMRAFFDSPKVDYCHARMLSAAWGGSVSDAKSTLGYKVANGYWDALAGAKDAARQHAQANPSARCSFGETEFTPADAKKLASMWSVGIDEAKVALASKYTYGLEDSVRAELRGG